MIDRIVKTSLKYPGLILLLTALITGLGVYEYTRMPVDAFPDISPVMVPVFAEGHGMAPEEIERLITYPIESAMNGLPGVTQIKSTSAFGMAVIYVYFADSVDIYFARQLVAERLGSALSDLPDMDDPPSLGPISTGLGQIFLYYLEADPAKVDTQGKPLDTWLRELNDWVVKYRLQTVPGVTDILSIGGHVLQYQIQVNPDALWKYKLTINDLVDAVHRNNRNVGGQFMVVGSEENLVRGIGLLEDIHDIRNIILCSYDNRPIFLSDVAKVEYGNEIRRGAVTRNGENEVVSGMVLKLYGENTSQVIERLYEQVDALAQTLPDGVRLVPYYEQAELVENATWTIKKALLLGGLLVIITLTLFLGSFRAAFIVALSLPVCALVAVLCMSVRDISANLMSLGGIAIAIGMLGDGAVVMVENAFRHLGDPTNREKRKKTIIYQAAKEVNRPIAFSIAVIILVFLPLFSLQGVEGKMFSPMASTMIFALLGSLFMAIVIVPVLSFYILKQTPHGEPLLIRGLMRIYHPMLLTALKHKKSVALVSLLAFAASIAMIPRLGTEFIPTLEEGSVMIGVNMAPSISLEEATRLVMEMEREIITVPEVDEVISRIGRPEAGSHPHPVNYAEIHIELKPFKTWTAFDSKQDMIRSMEAKLAVFPGVQLNFTQPIQNAFDELLAGVKAQLAIKIYGEDLTELQRLAETIRSEIDAVPGLTDLSVEQSFGQPQIQVVTDREACARYGVNAADIMNVVELAVGGEVIDSIYMNTRRFDIHIRMQEEFRNESAALNDILVPASSGTPVPIGSVAEVREVQGPVQINREKNQRRWIVQGNIRGRDIGSVVSDIQQILAQKLTLPPGYAVEYGGQFENQQRAMTRLSIIVPVTVALVMIMLWASFGVLRYAMAIFIMVPLSIIGGIFGLALTGQYLSVPASIGFIALFGIAMLDGMVLMTHINDLRKRGYALHNAVVEGAMLRLGPVLVTTLTTLLGLLPLLLAQGIGADVQRPLATVVVFGLASSTCMTLFVIPSIYEWIERRKRH